MRAKWSGSGGGHKGEKSTMFRYWNNLYGYRELLYFLFIREVKSKYKQTVLGVAWSLLQPLSLMIVFTVVFSFFARLPSDGVPYALFSYCALVPWQFFAGVLGRGAGSLLSNQVLVQKVYFPRELIPLAVVGAAVVDFAIGVSLFLVLLWFYSISLSVMTLLVIPVFLIQCLFVIGLIFLLAPMNVFYRDIGFIIPVAIQLMMFATPIIYPLSIVPARFRPYYVLNPMAGIIEGYRRILLHQLMPDWPSLGAATVISLLVFSLGFAYFKRVEFRLADVL
jgi:homopolymeric O-antigen transport system permease protein